MNRRHQSRLRTLFLPAAVFAGVFGGALYTLTPDAAGRETLRARLLLRFTDHAYADCAEARANGHEDIDSWEPSYRERMDGDADGVACEPYP